MSLQLRFLGAAGTVTGSKYVLTAGVKVDDRIMIDCGMFQGLKQLRVKNWEEFPVDPMSIGALVITHAHIDHSGYIPRLCKEGFKGPIYCTPASAKLIEILLLDSAYLQEEQAIYANKKGFSKHDPALPLYTVADARACLDQLRPVPYEEEILIGKHFAVSMHKNGHILGSGFVDVGARSNGAEKHVIFSGDLGRYGKPIMPNPESPKHADVLIIESTYGDRLHSDTDPEEELLKVITETVNRNGVVLIPAFAVDRTQTILYLLKLLEDEGVLKDVRFFMDSPMAIKVTQLYSQFRQELDPEARELIRQGIMSTSASRVVACSTQDESKSINEVPDKAVIISASGMATGGRILYHLEQRLPNPRNTVVLVGFQAAGTRGRSLLDGAKELKIHGSLIPVRAQVAFIDGFSGHADADELMTWYDRIAEKPEQIFITHGEPAASEGLQKRFADRFAMKTHIPVYNEVVTL